MIDWSGYIGLILEGALVTIELTIMGSALALVMAFLAGLGRLSRFFAVRALATVYIEFFRGTSIFVQLFWVYFVLPFAGVTLTPLQAGVLALGLNVGAYGAEVVRGAVRADRPRAARGLRRAQSWPLPAHAPRHPAAGAAADAADLRQQCHRAPEGHRRRLADLADRHDLPGAGGAGPDRQHAGPVRDHPRSLFRDGLVISAGVRWLERRVARGLDGVRV